VAFKRRFEKATGLSPLEYVHTLRLEEAKQMLEAGDEPVEAIANAQGPVDRLNAQNCDMPLYRYTI
jgi:transcriptional regulator GlxA family with amidase domain